MTFADAQRRAAELGLQATVDRRSGFCLLLSAAGGLMSRGGDWDEAFARLGAERPVKPGSPGPLFEYREEQG